jgi:hypothetical protein
MPEQQKGFFDDWKRNSNIIFNLCLMHQRSLVVVSRDQWGKQALGIPCALAFVLMFLWATFTQDPFMYGWMILWSFCYLKRRIEAGRLARKGIHSQWDGSSKQARRFRCSEKTGKLILEPMLFGIAGCIVLWFYNEQGWRPTGLPYFLLAGVFTLRFVAIVQQTIWDRRLEAMNDVRLEQAAAMRDYQDRYGNF